MDPCLLVLIQLCPVFRSSGHPCVGAAHTGLGLPSSRNNLDNAMPRTYTHVYRPTELGVSSAESLCPHNSRLCHTDSYNNSLTLPAPLYIKLITYISKYSKYICALPSG